MNAPTREWLEAANTPVEWLSREFEICQWARENYWSPDRNPDHDDDWAFQAENQRRREL